MAFAVALPSFAQMPSTQPTARSNQEVVTDLQSTEQQLADVLQSRETITNATKRQAAAPRAVPLLRRMLGDYDELAALHPQAKERIAQTQEQFLAFLSVMGDKDADARLATMAQSKDVDQSIHGQSGQLLARWILAGPDVAAQTKVADDIEAADKAHPQSISLTILTDSASHDAATDALRQRLEKLITDTMDNPAAASAKEQLAAENKLRSQENKPVTIAGTAIDNKPFTTASWKGKVVLVDFWATWCGPCREELPRVKEIYGKYHDQGLEIVGVSNDFKPDDLKDYIAKNNMPWPELFDADAAAQQQWNPTTLGFGINGIPTMFLIDKKGILRTVDARQNMEEMIPKLLAEQG